MTTTDAQLWKWAPTSSGMWTVYTGNEIVCDTFTKERAQQIVAAVNAALTSAPSAPLTEEDTDAD